MFYTQAVAALTAVYPTARFIFSWLNEFRSVVPTFSKATKSHEEFDLKVRATMLRK